VSGCVAILSVKGVLLRVCGAPAIVAPRAACVTIVLLDNTWLPSPEGSDRVVKLDGVSLM
jgi:hypothetical protein